MIMKIKNFLNRFRFLRKIRLLRERIERLRGDNYTLKGQLMSRRKTINELKENLVKSVNDLNLVSEKKKRGEIFISQMKKRRDEFLKRIGVAVPDASISNFADYKYWLSEPFIVDHYGSYEADKDIIDGVSAIRGFGKVLKKIDEKEDEFILP